MECRSCGKYRLITSNGAGYGGCGYKMFVSFINDKALAASCLMMASIKG